MAGPTGEALPGTVIAGPRRADAVRNRERVIAAAEEVFAEQGVEAGVPEIAERAGVGKGTVYRNFESKDELVAAVLVRRLTRFDEDIVDALGQDDPGEAFREVLRKAAARANYLSFPASTYGAGSNPELVEVKTRVTGSMERLIRKGKKAGVIRRDARVEEIWIQFGGVVRGLSEAGEQDPKAWRRHADLIADAFRPPAS